MVFKVPVEKGRGMSLDVRPPLRHVFKMVVNKMVDVGDMGYLLTHSLRERVDLRD